MTVITEQLPSATFAARMRLIRSFAMRDLKARFTTTKLGWAWALVVPLATVLIYSTVFSVIFRAGAPPMGNGHEGMFALWFFSGLVTWNVFAQASTSSLNSIVGIGRMMQKVYIPTYVPVLAATLTLMIEKCLESAVMLALMLFVGNVGWTWLFYPFAIVAAGAMAASLGYVLAVINVHFRDVGQIYQILLQLLFFLTPIIYPVTMIPESWHGIPMRSLLALNPLADLVGISRDLVYGLQWPNPWAVAYVAVWMVGLTLLAWRVHLRWGRDVSEAI